MKVDFIVSNASVYTVDQSFSRAESFAVKDGKFVAVGTSREMLSKYTSERILDYGGKTVCPGFIDAHCHFYGYGMDLMQYATLDGLTDKESIYKKLQEHQKKNGGDWVLGRGWDQNLWPEKVFPDNERLNEIFPDVPVYLVRVDGHAAWCNAKALEMAGMNARTKVDGGDVLSKNGKPTGVLIDNAMQLVFSRIPAPTAELKTKALLEAQKNCFAVGLTSVTDCGLPKETILHIDSLQKKGSLLMQMNVMMDPSPENMEYFLKKGPYETGRLQVRSIKLYADGALGSRGAYLLADYSDQPGNKGILMNPELYFDDICSKAYAAGYQVATHCIGDGANRFILNIYGKYLKGKNDKRWRIEHAQVVNSADFDLFGKYSVIPSVQATHATSDMLWADERLGPERIKGAYAYKQLLNQNGWIPNGTDFPIEDISPIKTFYAAVVRKNLEGKPDGGFQMENALSKEEALRSITIWAAKAGFQESKIGSIEIGKNADFVVLDTDIMQCNESSIIKTKVLKTVLGGVTVFDSEN
jgi:Predicted metal-dependent hydrolase with the TIM-barrel fold